MSREERFGIGAKIDALLLELLETIRKASYAEINSKSVLLKEAIVEVDSIRFFMQLAWEVRLIPHKEFEKIGTGVEEVGRMLGGWHRGILTKTPPPEK